MLRTSIKQEWAQPGRPVEFGGNHPALGGGMVEIARLKGEKIKGKEVRGQLQALGGKVDRDGKACTKPLKK